MTDTMRQRAIAFGERLSELDGLGNKLLNLRLERIRYVTGIYKIAKTAEADNLSIIISGIDRETAELVTKIAHLGGDTSSLK